MGSSARLIDASIEAVDVPPGRPHAEHQGQARLPVAPSAAPIGLLAGQGKKEFQADTGADDESTTANGVNKPRAPDNGPAASNRLQPLAATAKMDTSQQTPTQANEDRDYHVFYGQLPSSPAHKSTQHNTHDEPRTLNEGDTGAVNFGNLSDLARPSSQVSEDGGFDTTRGGWRANDRTSQLQSNPAQTPYRPRALPPETPALPKNPFAAKAGVAAPLAGSQLFGQTQHSSAVKISQPSSRPSPNLLLNSISPHIMETSPLKNRTNVTSPPDIQTSSPQRLDEVPEPLLHDRAGRDACQESPTGDKSPQDELIPESPTDKPFVGRQPLAQYEPMKQSQERKSSDDAATAPHYDDEYDEALKKAERRKRAERKRAQAAEEMERVSFSRGSRRESGEQPSKKKRRTHGVQVNPADSATVVNRARSHERALGRNHPKATAPEQQTPAPESIKATPAQSAAPPEAVQDHETPVQNDITLEPTEEEMIPATSPVAPTRDSQDDVPCRSEPELPVILDEGADGRGQDDAAGETSSFPPARRRTRRTYGTRTRKVRRNPFPSSSTSEALPAEPSGKVQCAASTLESPTSTASTAHPEAVVGDMARQSAEVEGQQPARHDILPSSNAESYCAPASTRLHGQDPVTPLQTRTSKAAVVAPSSSLTTLSTSPARPVNETPGTPGSLALRRPASLNMSPSTSSRNLSRRATRIVPNSESPQPLPRATRLARRSMILDSDTTDELHQSPSPSMLEKSATYLKHGRSFRQSIYSSHRGRRLFENMVFALSSQSEKPEQQRAKLESQIVQAGGSILRDGFQELFAPSSIMNSTGAVNNDDNGLRLPRASSGCGFTALIADGHSRKAKYMQALALGLPCLGEQWITACLGKGELVDWEPYLLCAGASAVLGDAIRSRMLEPYVAAKARLAEVIEHRRKLLDGQSILVLSDGKKGRNDTKQQYMFLVQALGPCAISRASTARQAREALRERQQAGRPFDWLYVDKSCGSAESVLSAPAPARGSGTTKRRKTGAKAATESEEPRVLTDELVIQSLILGRMVEVGEIGTRGAPASRR